jgi:hypothetical protein
LVGYKVLQGQEEVAVGVVNLVWRQSRDYKDPWYIEYLAPWLVEEL